jgi:hypothetical protein
MFLPVPFPVSSPFLRSRTLSCSFSDLSVSDVDWPSPANSLRSILCNNSAVAETHLLGTSLVVSWLSSYHILDYLDY